VGHRDPNHGEARRIPIEDRFWEYVDASNPSGCWPWIGKSKGSGGYGRTSILHVAYPSHRVAYELTNGPIPDGLIVRHTCDNPPCVNPAHLILGSHKDNARDAIERGRRPRGSQASCVKLTEGQVREIRELRSQGLSQYELARRFGVHRSTIKDIDSRRSWAHLDVAS
jgi:DNA-binding XRE family transcriptional regulator